MTATHTRFPPRVLDVDGDLRLSVLVIDDCPDTTGTTVELLRLAGHDAAAAASGRDGLAAADGCPPDVVLIDLGLPDLDGCEVARELRRRAGPKRPLLVAVTGYGTDGDRRRTAAAGFDLHLVKPVPPADLFRLLDRFARVLGR
ncbi:MAG: response regulator [Gemmataceae bacterium]|nr:response regulator [Gemmataceae bacterium]